MNKSTHLCEFNPFGITHAMEYGNWDELGWDDYENSDGIPIIPIDSLQQIQG